VVGRCVGGCNVCNYAIAAAGGDGVGVLGTKSVQCVCVFFTYLPLFSAAFTSGFEVINLAPGGGRGVAITTQKE